MTQAITHGIKPAKQKEVAFLCWAAIFIGAGGIQRLYVGKIGSGLLYLFTWGVFGIGQFVDLFLVSEMVDDYNRNRGYNLPGAYSSPLAQQQVVVNVGESIKSAISEIQTPQAGDTASKSDEQAILKACVDKPLTVALISVKTGIDPKRIKSLVEHLEAEGMLSTTITESGQIKYWIN